VRYLDFLDFGGIQLPSTIPRINVWKGKLIKHFSELDKGTDGIYGITPVSFRNTFVLISVINITIMFWFTS
jgi:hypothetical protein